MQSAEDRLRLVQKLAAEIGLPDAEIGIHVSWTNGESSAGLYTYPSGAVVFLNNAQHQVGGVAEAAALLRSIFADEIVVIVALEDGHTLASELARAEPDGSFKTLHDPSDSRAVPAMDEVLIETWGKGVAERG